MKLTSFLELHQLAGQQKGNLRPEFPNTVLNMDMSSPYASCRAYQVFLAAATLLKTTARIVVLDTPGGFFGEYAGLWNAAQDLSQWSIPHHRQCWHLRAEKLASFCPAYIGGLQNYHLLRREKVLALCSKVASGIDPNRLVSINLADSNLAETTSLCDFLSTTNALSGERFARVPCPYCSYKQSKKANVAFVSHWVKIGVTGELRLAPYAHPIHAKCPAAAILRAHKDKPISFLMRQTGIAFTGRSIYRWVAQKLGEFKAEGIVVRDYEDSAGAVAATLNGLSGDLSRIFVGTNVSNVPDVSVLLALPQEILAREVARFDPISNGSRMMFNPSP